MAKYKVVKTVWSGRPNEIKIGTIIDGIDEGDKKYITINAKDKSGKPIKAKYGREAFEEIKESKKEETITTSQTVPATGDSGKMLTILSSVGALAGLGVAYYRKSGVKGYIGYFILGSIVGSIVAHIVKPKGVSSLNLDMKQDILSSSVGDATSSDDIGQQYTLLSPYKAMDSKTMKDVDFNQGTVFVKKVDKNATNINMQTAVKVNVAPSSNEEYVIPVAILKKTGGELSKFGKVKKLFTDMASNPPKNQEEADARAAKFGVTKEDIVEYSSKQNKL